MESITSKSSTTQLQETTCSSSPAYTAENLSKGTPDKKWYMDEDVPIDLGFDKDAASAQYIAYLKTMISSLLENQLALSVALDETREVCSRLSLEKSELETATSDEVMILQNEISLCRQREAGALMAYEDLKHRVESIDKIVEQEKCLDAIFNHSIPLTKRCETVMHSLDDGCLYFGNEASKPYISTKSLHLDIESTNVTSTQKPDGNLHKVNSSIRRDGLVAVKDTHNLQSGLDSPKSDSGWASESHDELSLASIASNHGSPDLPDERQLVRPSKTNKHPTQNMFGSKSAPDNLVRSKSVMCHSNAIVNRLLAMQDSQSSVRKLKPNTVTLRGQKAAPTTMRWMKTSLFDSFTKFVDKAEWKMEALIAKQKEAKSLILMSETQAELRKLEARFCGLKRRQDSQEARMALKSQEIERLVNSERQLKKELRKWQQRVFELESETQEVKVNSHITALELKSRILDCEMQLAQSDRVVHQNLAFTQLLQTGLVSSLSLGSLQLEAGLDVDMTTKPPKPQSAANMHAVSKVEPEGGTPISTVCLGGAFNSCKVLDKSRINSLRLAKEKNEKSLLSPTSTNRCETTNKSLEKGIASDLREQQSLFDFSRSTSFDSLSELQLRAEF